MLNMHCAAGGGDSAVRDRIDRLSGGGARVRRRFRIRAERRETAVVERDRRRGRRQKRVGGG